jgi:hypothetical protein
MKTPFTKLRQLERYVQQLEKSIRTGRFAAFSAKKRKRFKQRIQRLQRELSLFGNSRRVKQAFTAAAIVLGLTISHSAEAQNFNFKSNQVNPFGISPTGGSFTFPTYGDLDKDGDLDMIAGEYDGNSLTFRYYENTGDSTMPAFAASQNNPFGLTPLNSSSFSSPQLVDIDGDGDLDIIAAEYYSITFYQNTGTANAPAFAAGVSNPFGLSANDNTTLAFGDLDDDGDYDIILGEYDYGDIQYYENIGTPTAPAFSNFAVNPFGLARVNSYSLVSMADVDGDGDLDVAVGEYTGPIQYFENVGTINTPSFNAPVADPFGITMGNNTSFVSPVWADIDKDGDNDLFGGVYYGGAIHYQAQNTAPMTSDTTVSTVKNTDYTFATSDFLFNDSDNSSFASIEVSVLPSQGALNLNGMPVMAGDTISYIDIPNLVFSPAPDSIGMPHDSIQFRAFDGYLYSDTSTIAIIVEAPVNTDNQTFINDRMIIAPNPVRSDLNLYFDFTAPRERARLIIIDNTGRVVHNESLTIPEFSSNYSIPVNKLQSGVYYIKLESNGEHIVQRFVKL